MSAIEAHASRSLQNDAHHETQKGQLLAIQISMTTLALLVVSLRVVGRYIISRKSWYDDHLMSAGMILVTVQTVLILSCIPYGVAQHFRDIPPTVDVSYTLKVFYATQLLHIFIVSMVKMSLLFFYLRLSPVTRFRRLVKATMVVCGLEAILFIFLTIFQCSPVSKAWLPTASGTCLNVIEGFKAATVFSLITNLIILLLPVPTIWNLHMSLRRRLLLLGTFAIGLFPIASLIARLIKIRNIKSSQEAYLSDPTWSVVFLQNWETVEYCSGMICASLIHLKPVIKAIGPIPLCPTRYAMNGTKTGSGEDPIDSLKSKRQGLPGEERLVKHMVSTSQAEESLQFQTCQKESHAVKEL